MNSLLVAIRNRLINDPELNNILPAENIMPSYNADIAQYPCAIIAWEKGRAGIDFSGVMRAEVVITIYSTNGKQELWSIYNMIRNLLHRQELSISNDEISIHLAMEDNVVDNYYDSVNRVWYLCSTYEFLATSKM